MPTTAGVAAHTPHAARAEASEPAFDSRVVPRNEVGGTSFLVVEDDEALRDLLEMALPMRGAFVTVIGSAAEARALDTPSDVALVACCAVNLRLPATRSP